MRMRLAVAVLVLGMGCASQRASGPAAAVPAPEKATPAQAAPDTGAETQHHLVMVLLERPELPDVAAVQAAFRTLAPAEEQPAEVKRHADQDGQALELTLPGGGLAVAMLMPFAIPTGEAEKAYALGISARTGHTLAPHHAHLAVFFREAPGRTGYQSLVRCTYLVAALTEASSAVAVYWGGGSVTHDRVLVLEVVRGRDPDAFPVLWFGFDLVQPTPGRISLLSFGLRDQLGLLDLHLTGPDTDPGALVGRAFDMVSYVAKLGADLPAGDTVGTTADEKLKVRHEPSPIDPQVTVWRVDVP